MTTATMRRAGLVIAGIATALLLTACGASSSDSSVPSVEASVDSTDDAARAALLAELRQQALDSGGTPDEVDCVMAELDGLPYEQLNEMLGDSPSAEVVATVTGAMQKCGVIESTASAPPG